jgi:NAD(P)-dependent dehydrogenase (short-subunit alcohol dehydrogenase family)
MKNIVIVGGSKGIGSAILLQQLENNYIYNISRNAPILRIPTLKHFPLDILQDALPEIENVDTVIYCPGSII